MTRNDAPAVPAPRPPSHGEFDAISRAMGDYAMAHGWDELLLAVHDVVADGPADFIPKYGRARKYLDKAHEAARKGA